MCEYLGFKGVPIVKCLIFTLSVFLSLNANAAYECTASVFAKGKKVSESKIDLKQNKEDKRVFAAEREGYKFELVFNESDADQVERLIVYEKATGVRSTTGFGGLKAEKPGATYMTAILNEGSDPKLTTGGRLVCRKI
jgi:hypothetical protein